MFRGAHEKLQYMKVNMSYEDVLKVLEEKRFELRENGRFC
jgi:hypothetical protein